MRIVLLATMIIFASTASAGLYKWVDNEGNVHYSQKRPKGKQFKRIKVPASAPTDSKPLYQSETKKDNKTVADESAKNAKARAANCKNAKGNLKAYQVYRRIRDKAGNVTVVGDEERAKKITQAKRNIDNFCD